jgi:glycosyltransferase involved in cell wall biosynthesis
MSVLELIKGLGRGGTEQLVSSTARLLDRRFEVEVAFLLPWKDALVKELEGEGVVVHCLDGARGFGWATRLRRLVRHRRIDLVHAHSPVAAAAARVVFGHGRPRLVYTEHNVWPRYHPATRWANLLTFPRNDHVFAVSDEVRSSIRYPEAISILRMPPVETLYHGIDADALARSAFVDGVRQELGIVDGVPLVGTVANFKAHKGHQVLLEAARLVRARHAEARFVLIGRGPLEDEVRRQVNRMGLDGSVAVLGYRQDAVRLTGAFDVFVLPSLYEGLPIALLEAMALERPVVATRVGGTPEVVTDGVDGLLVPGGDPRALAERIVRLIDDVSLRTRLGRAAGERARRFDIRPAVRRMEQVYEELLQ